MDTHPWDPQVSRGMEHQDLCSTGDGGVKESWVALWLEQNQWQLPSCQCEALIPGDSTLVGPQGWALVGAQFAWYLLYNAVGKQAASLCVPHEHLMVLGTLDLLGRLGSQLCLGTKYLSLLNLYKLIK